MAKRFGKTDPANADWLSSGYAMFSAYEDSHSCLSYYSDIDLAYAEVEKLEAQEKL